MDYNQKKNKAKEDIKAYVIEKNLIVKTKEELEKEDKKFRKVAKQFGLTKYAEELGL